MPSFFETRRRCQCCVIRLSLISSSCICCLLPFPSALVNISVCLLTWDDVQHWEALDGVCVIRLEVLRALENMTRDAVLRCGGSLPRSLSTSVGTLLRCHLKDLTLRKLSELLFLPRSQFVLGRSPSI